MSPKAKPKETTAGEHVRDFCARVTHLCHYVIDANTLTDIITLKDKAKALEAEALGVSKAYCP